MPSRPKRNKAGRPKDESLPARRRAEIVRHAIEEFASHGYNGADLDVIARDSGCSKGTLYNYFSSKDQLFSASVDQVMFSMIESIGSDEEADPVAELAKLVEGFLAHFSKFPQYVELLVQERSDFRDRKTPTFFRYRAVSRDRWIKRFKQLIAAGRMRKMSAEQALNVLANLLYGTIFLNHFRGRRPKPAQQANELLQILLGGLLTPDEFVGFSQKRP